MNISASELNRRPGKILEEATKEPVIIENKGIPTAVIISYEHYVELKQLANISYNFSKVLK